MPIDPIVAPPATPDPRAGASPSLAAPKERAPSIEPDRFEHTGESDPARSSRALQLYGQALASAAAATIGRGLEQSAKAAPEIVDGAAMRMAGLAGVVLSMPGDTPRSAVHGGEAIVESRQFKGSVALTASGTRAVADVKSHCDPGDFQSFDGPGAHDALRRAMKTPPGEALHHLVEQNKSNANAFGTEAIQNTRNAINLPKNLHDRISGFYSKNASRAGLDHGGRVRDYVNSLPYARQREFAIKTTRSFTNSNSSISAADRQRILDQLAALERTSEPGSCLPEQK